jgi:hypothetical protein
MGRRFKAIYRNGTLVPLQPLDLPEESSVELELVAQVKVMPPPIVRPNELGGVEKSPEKSDHPPVYRIAGLFTRDELHERR